MTATDNLTNALLFVFALNLLMFFVGHGLTDLGAGSPFNEGDNLLSKFNGGNTSTYDIPSDIGGSLPGGEATTVSPDTGLSLTDVFTSIKEWFVNTTGLGFVLNILSGPKIILTYIFGPEYAALAWALTAFWYGITLFFLVAFFWGR